MPPARATAPDGLTPCAGHGKRPTRARARNYRSRRARGAVPGGGGGDAREYSEYPKVPHEYPVSTSEYPLDRLARGAIRSESGGPRAVCVPRATLKYCLSTLWEAGLLCRGGYAVVTRWLRAGYAAGDGPRREARRVAAHLEALLQPQARADGGTREYWSSAP